jgi:regulator of sigma E protease
MAWLTLGFAWLTIQKVVIFLILLTVLVFVHELGHYLVARWNRVRVEVFSIGFGRELFGWNDRAGTRWKFSAVPLGGYVKMFGDADPASMPGEQLAAMTPAEKAQSFHHKRLSQRAAVVAAGPIANFILAIAILTVIIAVHGQPFTPPEVGKVLPGSAAEAAGIQPGDVIVAIDGTAIDKFETIKRVVEVNTGTQLQVTIRRGDRESTLPITPTVTVETNRLGYEYRVARLGITTPSNIVFVARSPIAAVWYATVEAWTKTGEMLSQVVQMMIGVRSGEGLSGPIGIFQISGAVAQEGFFPLIELAALLSLNLGLINLFPIPVLDGGHLLFYAAEAIRGKPLSQRAQEYGFRLGLALVLALMMFATWNDLVRISKFWSS